MVNWENEKSKLRTIITTINEKKVNWEEKDLIVNWENEKSYLMVNWENEKKNKEEEEEDLMVNWENEKN